MALTVPNESEAPLDPIQSTVYETDIKTIVVGFSGNGVLSGCAVTAQGTPDNTVAVSAGTVHIGGNVVSVSAGNVTMPSADATNPTWVLITVDDSGTKTATGGVAAISPLLPAIPADSIVLASVFWPANATIVAADNITDKRIILTGTHDIIVGASDYTGYATYTCDGVDDQVQIQSAIDSLGSTGGRVILSSGTFIVAEAGTVTGDSLSTPYCILIDADNGPIILQGAGMDATTIQLADSQGANVIPILMRGASAGKRINPTAIRDLALNGNSATQATWTDFGLVEAIYSDFVTLERVHIYDAPFFLTQTFRDSQFAHWRNCHFVSSATNHQVRFEAPGVTVVDCDFEGADGATAGALLSLATNADIDVNTREARIVGNRFRGGFQAISIGGGHRCIVANNNIENQTNTNSESIKIEHYAGAVNYSAEDNIITGNILYNVRNGITLGSTTTYGAKRTLVTHNKIIDGPDVNLSNGIREVGASVDNNVIEFNQIVGAVTPITVVGASTIARNNVGTTSTADFISGVTVRDTGSAIATRPAINFIEGANVTLTLTDDSANGEVEITIASSSGGGVTATELDGSPSITATTLEFPNGTLSDQGGGIARYTPTAPITDRTQIVEYYDDFLLTLPTVSSVSGTASIIRGDSSNTQDSGGNPGWASFQTGTTTSGRAVATQASNGNQVLLGNGAWVWETLLVIPVLSDGTDTFSVTAGFNDSPTGIGNDVVAFRYTHSASSGNWECYTRSNAAQTLTNSAVAVVAATKYKLRIEIDATASNVVFKINGSTVATHSTNIPSGSGRQTSIQLGIVKSAGTTSREVVSDYIYARCDLTSAR